MHFQSSTFLAAELLAGLAAFPAVAAPNCLACGIRSGAAVPGPVAGVGLGYLVLAGGYYVVRRWRKQNPGE
jgi:hypothetical protein